MSNCSIIEKLYVSFVDTQLHFSVFLKTSRLFPKFALSTNNFDKKINIYPNPFQNKLNIQTDEDIKSIEIFDLLGKQVLNSKDKNIDVSMLQNGIYLVKINTENGTLIEKIIKQ